MIKQPKKHEELCEDGLEHESTDCPNCHCTFCSSCGKVMRGEESKDSTREEATKELQKD